MKLTPIINEPSLEKLCQFLSSYTGMVALDVETETTNPYRGEIVGIGLSWEEEGGVYIPINHRYVKPFEPQNVLGKLKKPLETVNLCCFNAPFDVDFLELKADIHPKMPVDVSLLAYVNAKYEGSSLKFISSVELEGVKTTSYKELMVEFGLSPTKNTISELPIEVVTNYCGRDALATLLLYNKLYKNVQNHPIYALESRVLPVTMWIRRNGVLVDPKFFEEEEKMLLLEVEHLQNIIESQVSEAAGSKISFNIGSSKQLGHVIYDILKLRCDDHTKTGQPKTDKEQLAKYKWKHPLIKNIITYKELQKLVSTYYTNYMGYVESDGRIHASFNQSGAPTGRFSCSDPNLQNIPSKKTWTVETPAGSKGISANMRNGFIPPGDCWMMEFDYSQIEARLAAGVTQEPILLHAFMDGVDYHTKTASLVFKVPVESVTKEQRFMGKKLNFALSYGMGSNKLWRVLSEEMPITYKEAQYFRDQYVNSYPTMFHSAEVISKDAERNKGVTTLFGRRIPIFQFNRKDDSKAIQEGYRMAYNGVIQGSAADIMKRGMVRAYSLIKRKYGFDDVRMIMTIHDSMIFEVKKTVNVEEFVKDIVAETSIELQGFPPIFVESAMGTCWGNFKSIKKNETASSIMVGFGGVSTVTVDKKPSRVFVIELPEFDGEGYARTMFQVVGLRNFILDRPGNNKIVLKIGQREQELPFSTDVSLEDKDRIALVIGGKMYERI